MLLWRNADKPLISVPCGSSGLWNCYKQAKNSRNQSPALIRQALPHSGIKSKLKGGQIQTSSRPKNCTRDTKDRMETNLRQIGGHSYSKTEESGAGIP